MANYVGVPCPVCGNPFAANDDVVVCPACGAPHHRSCYMQAGQCALEKDHQNGKAWKPLAAAQEPPQTETAGTAASDTKYCPQCGTANSQDGIFCIRCGTRFGQSSGASGAGSGGVYGNYAPSESYGGIAPDMEYDGVSAQELVRYIGPTSTYYLQNFHKMHSDSSRTSFNVSAMFFGPLFYLYRKLYTVGLLLLAFYFVMAFPGFLYSVETFPIAAENYGMTEIAKQNGIELRPVDLVAAERYRSIGSITNIVYFVVQFVVALFANHLYYRQAIRAVKDARQRVPDYRGAKRTDFEMILAFNGGVSRYAVIAGILLFYSGTAMVVNQLLY